MTHSEYFATILILNFSAKTIIFSTTWDGTSDDWHNPSSNFFLTLFHFQIEILPFMQLFLFEASNYSYTKCIQNSIQKTKFANYVQIFDNRFQVWLIIINTTSLHEFLFKQSVILIICCECIEHHQQSCLSGCFMLHEWPDKVAYDQWSLACGVWMTSLRRGHNWFCRNLFSKQSPY